MEKKDKKDPGTGLQTQTNRLPSLDELHYDVALAFKNDQLNLLLNQNPPASWVKKHPIVKKKILNAQGVKIDVPSEFIPVDHVEFLLTRIYQQWRFEILREGALFNSVYVTGRLHLLHPITGEWTFMDGTGAVGVQTDKDKSASDLSAIKQAAIQMALPAAVSYALKDAAERLGKIFGKDLNRQDAIDFSMAYNTPAAHARQEENPGAVPNADSDPDLATLDDYQILHELMSSPDITDKFHYVEWSPQALYDLMEKNMATGEYMSKESFKKYFELLTAEIKYSQSQKGV